MVLETRCGRLHRATASRFFSLWMVDCVLWMEICYSAECLSTFLYPPSTILYPLFINVTKVQKISETTKYFGKYFGTIFYFLSPQSYQALLDHYLFTTYNVQALRRGLLALQASFGRAFVQLAPVERVPRIVRLQFFNS